MDNYQKCYLLFLLLFIPFSLLLIPFFPFYLTVGNTTYHIYLVSGYGFGWDLLGWGCFGAVCGLDAGVIYEVFR
jgi:hypothetical protein